MVPSPALQAASEALAQLQSKSRHSQPTLPQHAKTFSAELSKQLAQHTTSGQLLTTATITSRPLVYIPMAAEMMTSSPGANTTQKRNKKNRPSYATNDCLKRNEFKK